MWKRIGDKKMRAFGLSGTIALAMLAVPTVLLLSNHAISSERVVGDMTQFSTALIDAFTRRDWHSANELLLQHGAFSAEQRESLIGGLVQSVPLMDAQLGKVVGYERLGLKRLGSALCQEAFIIKHEKLGVLFEVGWYRADEITPWQMVQVRYQDKGLWDAVAREGRQINDLK